MRIAYLVAPLALVLAGCGSGGSGDKASTVTGPTNPSVVVNCQDVTGQGSGNTSFTVNVDCGDRNSNNTGKTPPATEGE